MVTRKTVIDGPLDVYNMHLIDLLFPGLNGPERYFTPDFPNKNEPWSVLSSGDGNLISQITSFDLSEDGIYIHEDAKIGDYVRIEGPCYIGAGAEVRHSAFLRKGSWICEGAIVGHSTEVKNSVMLPNSKAPHFNYVGDSIIGFGANIGAGAKLSNVRNDKREVLVMLENGERVPTGLRKLGALIGDGSNLGCNVVTNPGSIVPTKSMVGPNETVSGWFSIKS